MTLKGVDSAFGPTLVQAATAKIQDVVWWGLYIAGSAAYHVWTDTEISVLRDDRLGIAPLPIVVPAQNLSEDPVAVAGQAMARCEALGIYGAVAVDFEYNADAARLLGWLAAFDAATAGFTVTGRPRSVPSGYDGPHLPLPAGVARWDPLPGRWVPGDALASRQAVQWASASIAGLSVDLNEAADDFPLGSWTPPPAVAVDLSAQEAGTMLLVETAAGLHLFAVGTDQGVYHATAPDLPALTTAGWTRLGKPTDKAKAVGGKAMADGSIILTVHGTDDRPYLASMTAAGVWSPFTVQTEGELWPGMTGPAGPAGAAAPGAEAWETVTKKLAAAAAALGT